MTFEEKKERRKLRHELQRRVKLNHFRGSEMKLGATAKQMNAAARKVTDQIFAGKNPAAWVQA